MTGQCYSSDEEIDSILPLGLALRERHMVCRKPLLDLEGIVVDEERDAIDIYLSALEYATRYILMHCCYPICECCGAENLFVSYSFVAPCRFPGPDTEDEKRQNSEDYGMEKGGSISTPLSSKERLATYWHKILYWIAPTNTTFGRTLLFVFTYFMALWLLVWWWGPGNVSMTSLIGMLSKCERTRKYCGEGQHPLWNGFSDPVPVACPSKGTLLPTGLQTYCDSRLLLSHSFAVFLVSQTIAVVCWALVWIAFEHFVLRIKRPYTPAKVASGHEHIDEFHRNIYHPDSWHRSLQRYKTKVEKRASLLRSGACWRFVQNTAMVVSITVFYTFVATSFSVWYWLRPSRDIASRLMIPYLVSMFVQIFCDPEAIPKILQAVKQSRQTQQEYGPSTYDSKHGEPLLKAAHSCCKEQDWQSQCCMFIACHMSASSEAEATQLQRTLEAALVHLQPNQIFVCDNANTEAPPDETESLVEKIHPEINYLFIPVGNKSHAFYWTEKYWLSHLQEKGIIPSKASKYILMVDDDVRLPPNFSIPLARLSGDSNIAAVQYPVVASDPQDHALQGKPLLVGLQDIEYVAHHKIPETQAPFPTHNVGEYIRWCPPVFCSGALSVWRREDLREVLQQHDSVFDGEDQQMGLILLAQRSERRMIVCDDVTITIPTTAPATMGDFLRQRIKSWDMIAISWGPAFFFRNSVEAIYHGVIGGHKPSLKASLWFLRKGMTALFAFNPNQFLARILVLWWYKSASIHESVTVSAIFLLIVPCFVSYLNPLINYAFCARHTPTWRLPAVRELVAWPLFSFLYSVTFFLSCIYNLTAYGHAIRPPTMASREHFGDVPPCPPMSHPDWKTIWKL